jgi:hypothetical protein
MKCDQEGCGGRTDSVDGRYVEQGYWRRRICQACGHASTTIEQVCVTEKGNRLRPARIQAPKPPVVKLPRQRDPAHKPTRKGKPVLDQYAAAKAAGLPTPAKQQKAAREVSSRSRIEDLKMQRELEREDAC